MSAPHVILDCLPSLCQKLSELVDTSPCYDKNNLLVFRHCVERSLANPLVKEL